MTTTERGKLSIETDENNNHCIVFEPANGTVWMEKFELAQLFGVYIQTITAHLDAVYKTKAFRAEETSKYDFVVSGNSIRYDKTEFKLEIIIAVAFRVDSWQAKLIREWFMQMLFRGNLVIDYPIPNNRQDFEMN